MKERGFVFSLDACLATVVMMIAVAGLAHLETGRPGHGHLRLERCAQDALSVMNKSGVTKYIIDSLNNKQYAEALRSARENLLLLLPPKVNFRYTIGAEESLLLEVYKDESENWKGRWENAVERAVAVRFTCEFIRPVENLDVLVWVDGDEENRFAENVIKSGWIYRTTNDKNTFVDYLENKKGWYPDVVFLPDVSVYWDDDTLSKLVDYNMGKKRRGGGLVVGGETIWSNRRGYSAGSPYWQFLQVLGISPEIERVEGPGFSRMELDPTHYITTGLENILYQDNYGHYIYRPLYPGPKTLGKWENWENENITWPGLLAREVVTYPQFMERTVLFNVRMAQSSLDNTRNGDEMKGWITSVQRAIEWASRQRAELQPIVLYVWRER